jgi:radical SAM-linked protein
MKTMTQAHTEGIRRIRLRYSKTGVMRFLSHLEAMSVFSRAVSRAAVPIRFSQGFHPHPKFSFATALAVGVDSYAEYMDMEIEPSMEAAEVCHRLNNALPDGMHIMEAWEIPAKATSLSVIMELTRYRVILPDSNPSDLAERTANFLSLESFPWSRERKRGTLDLDLRKELAELRAKENSLLMLVGRGKPIEFAAAILGVLPAELKEARIEKLEVTFRDDASSLLPAQDAIS